MGKMIKALLQRETGVILPWNEILATDGRMDEVEVEEGKPLPRAGEAPEATVLPVDDPMLAGPSRGAGPAAVGATAGSPGTPRPGQPTGPEPKPPPKPDDDEEDEEETPRPPARGRR